MTALRDLRVKLFADGADLAAMRDLAQLPYIAGFTTNPSLMRTAGVKDYAAFGRAVLDVVGQSPVSFEVFADDFAIMEQQAREIAGWGPGVYVKIPVSDTRGTPSSGLLRRLAAAGVKVNVTAVFTLDQVRAASEALAGGPPAIISVFAGRIADTGRDPVPHMASAVDLLRTQPQQQLLWGSPREVLNVIQADRIGCHIITLTPDLIRKLALLGKPLEQYSRETVGAFHRDASEAGLRLDS